MRKIVDIDVGLAFDVNSPRVDRVKHPILVPDAAKKTTDYDAQLSRVKELKGYGERRAAREAGYERTRLSMTMLGRLRLWWRDRQQARADARARDAGDA